MLLLDSLNSYRSLVLVSHSLCMQVLFQGDVLVDAQFVSHNV
jgi:hypothetical protein